MFLCLTSDTWKCQAEISQLLQDLGGTTYMPIGEWLLVSSLLCPALLFFSGLSVGPMCLPEPGEQFKAGLICITAGWGRQTEGKNFYASNLNHIQNFLLDNQKIEILICF